MRHPLGAALNGYQLALGQPGYRRLWLAAVLSRTGDTVNFAALPLFVFDVTHRAGAVGATVFVESIGLVIGAAAGQLIVDRVPPRRLLVTADMLRAGAAGVLTLLPSFPTAVAVSFGLALGTAIFSPVSNAVVPRLVPDRALPGANGLQWTAGVALQLLASPLGGLLVALGLARVAFGLNAISFLGSAVLLIGLPELEALEQKPRGVWLQVQKSFGAVRQVPLMLPLLTIQGLAALAVGATSALLVVLARQAYGLNGTGYGLWLSAIAIGALIGPVMVPVLEQLRPSRVVSAAYVIRGAGDIGLGLLYSGVGGAFLLALYGVNTSSGMVSFQTLVQRTVPPDLRGRAFALLDFVWQAARLLSVAAGAALVEVIGIRDLFLVGGALLFAAGGIGFLTLEPGRR